MIATRRPARGRARRALANRSCQQEQELNFPPESRAPFRALTTAQLHYPLRQLRLACPQRLHRRRAHELAEVSLGGRVARRLRLVSIGLGLGLGLGIGLGRGLRVKG